MMKRERKAFKKQIVAACKHAEPNPEHGPGQYAVVIDHLMETEGESFFDDKTLREAVDSVLEFMEIAC